MPSLVVECPTCWKKYRISERLAGTSMTCTGARCGRAFLIPELPKPDEPEVTFSEVTPDLPDRVLISEEKVGKILGYGKSDPNSRAFADATRIIFVVGAISLSLGLYFPTSVDGGKIHNLSLGDKKISVLIVGVGCMVAGSVLWASSGARVSKNELLAIQIWSCVITLMIISQFLFGIYRSSTE